MKRVSTNNLARTTLMLLLVAFATVAFSQNTKPQWTTVIDGTPASMTSQLISSSEESITVRLQVPGFYTATVSTPEGEAKVITVPGSVNAAHAGEPDVPMMGIPAIIGNQARMDIRVIDAKYMDFDNIMVAPSKGDFPRTIDPASVPYTYGDCYKKDAFFPASTAELYEPYILRDYRGQNIAVHPFVYNPVTKTLRVYYDMTVEMYKVDDNGQNTLEPRRSSIATIDPDFKNVYSRHFINYQASQDRYTPLEEEGDLLIICYDDFIYAMTDFVNWKRTRGVNTTIVGTTTTGSTYSAIKTYIQKQYNANNNITHVLLVGDVAQIPGYSYSGGGSSYSGKGDNAYGQIVGSDIYNDIIIGRFSASSAARVTTQANRAINYERDLTTSDTWLLKAEGISRKEDGSGHNNEDDYQHMNNIRQDLLEYGYSTVYQRYANLTGYDASSSTISSDINNGVGLIAYANHGQETAWGANQSGYVYYSNSHVNALTNENKLPFIFSVACLVGKYDHSSDCFAEAWMNATNNNNPTGAVGTMMSYISQPWIPPMWAQDECIDILVGNSSTSTSQKYTYGGVCINGLMSIFDHYSTSEQSAVGTYQAWIVYGDPTLMVRTKTPQEMTVNHAGSIVKGSSVYEISVSNGDGAVVTITDTGHNILGKGKVINGTATVNLNSNDLTPNTDLTLCVFGYNKVTYLGTINVIATGEQYAISATVNPSEGGTVSGTGTYYENSYCTLKATANSGYGFTNWTLDGTEVSTDAEYRFQVTGEATYTANFHQLEQHNITFDTKQDHGTISVNPTVAYAGDIVTLTATPDAGYVLDHWVVNAEGTGSVEVVNNQFTMPDCEVTISATFKPEIRSLTVYDGTATNQYIPMYGYYFDDYTKSECIIPAPKLTDMNGGIISAITFYPSSVATTNSTWTESEQTIFLKEVSGTTLDGSYSGMSDATVVKVGSPLDMPTAGTAYTILFDTPYTYNGGNLLIGVYNDDGSKYNKVEWYGTSGLTSGVSAYGYNNSSLDAVSYNAQSFLPKTTFTYTPDLGTCAKPINLQVVGTPGKDNVQLNWTAGGSETQWQICINNDATDLVDVTEDDLVNGIYTLSGLTPITEYTVKVRAYCDASDQSGWSNAVTFTTDTSCPTPTITNINVTAHTATISTNSDADNFNVRYRNVRSNRDNLVYDFEDGWQGWTTFQGSTTSPNSWMHNTEYVGYTSQGKIVTECHNSSAGMMLSESYISATTSDGTAYGAVTPDNYLVSPQILLGGSITFYAAARLSNYPEEKFSVLVSESGNTSASDFTHTELTVTLSDNSWNEYTVDLSAYSGMGYVAIRHHDCYDQHLLYIDDVTIEEGEYSQWQTTNSLTITGLESATTYQVQVLGDYGIDGVSNWSETATFTTLEDLEFANDDSQKPDNEKNAVLISGDDGTAKDVVLVGRTLWKDNTWNTLCLPFSMTAEQVTTQLAPTELKELDITNTYDGHTTGIEGTTLYLYFKDAISINAGVPYLIKWEGDGSNNIVNPLFTGVTINKADPTEVEFTGGKFVGSYSSIAFTANDMTKLYLGSENKLFWPDANMTLGAFRAHFQMDDEVNSAILYFGDETTDVRLTTDNRQQTTDGYYTLDGRKLNSKPTQKGIYIHNGKKVVIK